MPRAKKKEIVLDEEIIPQKKIISPRARKKIADSPGFNLNNLTKGVFAAVAVYGTAAMLILLIFFSINSSISILIEDRNRLKNFSISANNHINKKAGDITYAADKSKYGLEEEIKLSITNTTNKSIFLAPCQYFNKFEKKELNLWKEVVIVDCERIAAINSSDFEKISSKEKRSILAAVLGEGVWRGVSDVYIDCQKAEVSACKNKKIVYSNEFKIEAQKTELPGVL